MLISLQHRFIFVANRHTDEFECASVLAPYAEISRTGSALRRCLSWSDIKSEYQFVLAQPKHHSQTFRKFGVVRDPVDWVRAFYRNRWQSGEPGSDPESQQLDFAPWWERNADKLTPWDQAPRLVEWNGTSAMDLVIPYEQRREVLDAIRSRLSLPPLRWADPGALSDIDTHPDVPDALRQQIREHFADSTALHADALLQWDSAPSVGQALKAQARNIPAVRVATLLHLPVVVGPEVPLRVAGVLLLDPAAGGEFQLVVQGAVAVDSVETNLPSPAFAKLYPGNAQAAQAKFVIDGLRMGAHSTATVRLGVGDEAWDWLTLRS